MLANGAKLKTKSHKAVSGKVLAKIAYYDISVGKDSSHKKQF